MDLATADLVIGTSAGSILGSLLLGGADSETITKLIASPDQSPLQLSGKPKTDGDPMANLQVLTLWSAVPEMDSANAVAIAEAASRGKTMTEDAWVESFTDALGSIEWSSKMRIVSIDTTAGERKLWSADDGAPLDRVVASSCAVPGIFPAVEVGGRRYVDGGMWSPTSADLLPVSGIENVVIVSPLGGDADWVGAFSDRATERELKQLRDRGVVAELVRPDEPMSPLAAFDESKRVASFELGIADGRAAAERVGGAL